MKYCNNCGENVDINDAFCSSCGSKTNKATDNKATDSFDKDKSILKKWAKSKDLWKRRIAIVSTAYFIRQHYFQDTIEIAKLLLNDTEDLIHKAVGWMLREMGKRDLNIEESFLISERKALIYCSF